MTHIAARELPPGSLLAGYRSGGAYTDCFVATIPGRITQARYVEAFYTTPLFRVERWLLARFLARESTDADARRLAEGSGDTFAAWRVEARTPDQLLLCDINGQTRSWLMSVFNPESEPPATTLYFGSAVVPAAGRRRIGLIYRLLLGFHVAYSRALLRAAVARLTD